MSNRELKTNQDYGKELFSWELKEYENRDVSRFFNLMLMIITAIILLYALWSANFLFALFIILAVIVIILNENKETLVTKFSILEDGILIGDKFYEYNYFKDFAIVYNVRKNMKRLYFEFESPIKQRLSIPLYNVNPLLVKKELKKFLREDLDRTDIPLSEQLGRLLGF